MTYIGLAASSGQLLFDTGDNALHDFGTLEGDLQGTIKDATVSGIIGYPIVGTPGAGQVLKFDGSQWTFQADVSGVGGHNILSATHQDAVPNPTLARGDIIVGSGTGPTRWNRLPLGTAEFVLYSDGTDATYTRLGPNTPFELGSAAAPSVTFTGDLDTGVSAADADTLVLSASGVELLTVDGTTGTIELNAAQAVKTRVVGVSTAMTNDDYGILATAGGITITLPGGPTTGQVVVIKDRDGSASGGSPITISGNGANIDGNASILLRRRYGAFTLLWNGASWNVI